MKTPLVWAVVATGALVVACSRSTAPAAGSAGAATATTQAASTTVASTAPSATAPTASAPAAAPASAPGALPEWMTQTRDDPSAAEIFVRGLYSRYGSSAAGGGDTNGPLWVDENLYTPALAALMHEDTRLANGEVGYMDSDPICQCQDWENLQIQSLDFTPGGPGRTDAAVAITSAGRTTRLTLKLQLTPAGWRVADVRGGEEASGLVAALTRANAEAARRNAGSRSGARP